MFLAKIKNTHPSYLSLIVDITFSILILFNLGSIYWLSVLVLLLVLFLLLLF